MSKKRGNFVTFDFIVHGQARFHNLGKGALLEEITNLISLAEDAAIILDQIRLDEEQFIQLRREVTESGPFDYHPDMDRLSRVFEVQGVRIKQRGIIYNDDLLPPSWWIDKP